MTDEVIQHILSQRGHVCHVWDTHYFIEVDDGTNWIYSNPDQNGDISISLYLGDLDDFVGEHGGNEPPAGLGGMFLGDFLKPTVYRKCYLS